VKKPFILIFIILILAGRCPVLAEDEDDIQIWNRFSIRNFQIEDLTLTSHGQIRGRDVYDRLQNWEVGQSATYAPYEHTRFSLGFFLRKDNMPEAGDAPLEYRWVPAISHSVPLGEGGLSLTIRNRIDIRLREYEDDLFNRSRHRFGLKHEFAGDGVLDYLFGHTELFYDWREGDINQYRVTPAGIGIKLNEHVTLEAFYTLRFDDRGSPWDRTHVLGTHMKIKF
jgi:hypothetical protein